MLGCARVRSSNKNILSFIEVNNRRFLVFGDYRLNSGGETQLLG